LGRQLVKAIEKDRELYTLQVKQLEEELKECNFKPTLISA
jgi:hypothetical protein